MSPLVQLLVIALIVFTLSTITVLVVRKVAVTYGFVDLPNQRSSHSVVTPRGGGVAFVIASSLGLFALSCVDTISAPRLLALGAGGLVIAGIGLIDDRLSVSAPVRLLVHVLVAVSASMLLGGVHSILVGSWLLELGVVGYFLAVVGIVWALNLFNFMDGIDGLAASEAIFIFCAGAIISLMSGATNVVYGGETIFAAACTGFLVWNWPPARIFMGDVGSGYLGYVIAILAIMSNQDRPGAIFVWLILGGVFLSDASVALIRRSVRGERIFIAHRSHAYQRLARRWRSHRRTTIAVIVIDVFWLFPWAIIAVRRPGFAFWATIVALTPLVILMLVVGSGRPERD